mgnify:CR=1 FL=1
MAARKLITERKPQILQVGAGAMQQHDRQILRTLQRRKVEHVQAHAVGGLEEAAQGLRWGRVRHGKGRA